MRRSRSPFITTKRRKLTENPRTTVDAHMADTEQKLVTVPHSHQTELMEQARMENLIVCMPTGSGKTYIAVLLIKEMSHAIRASIDDGGKRTIFLVKTVALVQQQSEYIRIHTDLTVGRYHGELGVDLWDKQKWMDEFEHHQVLIFTAQVFLNLVDHNFFPLYKVNLLIFDECHHATGENCYAALMNRHYDTCHDPPRILGLTASISARKIKPHQLAQAATDVEATFRARIASGSNREENNRHGTSVRVEPIFCVNYKQSVLMTNESLMIPLEIIQSMSKNLSQYVADRDAERKRRERELSELMLTTDYLGDNITNYNTCSVNYTIFLQSEYMNISRLKEYLDDLLNIASEVGLQGLLLAATALRRRFKSSQALDFISDDRGKELFNDSVECLDCLIDDILSVLVVINEHNNEALYSAKTRTLFQRLTQDIDGSKLGRCIVFVQRVNAAYVLAQVLTLLAKRSSSNDTSCLKIRYITGPKAYLGDVKMSANYLRQVIKEFRTGAVDVLVATAVVEEGLDVPQCNLVVRFNKPDNFSSYMQSKGRARAKQNACYVLLIDESDQKKFDKDKIDYENYEQIEQMLRDGFSIGDDGDFDIAQLNQLESYRTDTGVVISATRAAQIIHEYCAVLGNGRPCLPQILSYETNEGTFKSILSMPANCPVRDDIICENRRKKLAKFECCLQMVKLLHERKELNEHCLPHHRRSLLVLHIPVENALFKLCDQLFEKKTDSTMERFPKQIASFPTQTDTPSNSWHLYRINIRADTDALGFVVPFQLVELPNFNLCAASSEPLTVNIAYVQAIDYTKHREELERFSRYLFENVFEEMTNGSDSILEFDIDRAPFKLLPCLLKSKTMEGGSIPLIEIDTERMQSICCRLNKSVENHSLVSEDELYVAWHLPNKQQYVKAPGSSSSKRTSDRWEHRKKSEAIRTYADFFQEKVPNVLLKPDSLMVEMRAVHKPRINYLYPSSSSATTSTRAGLSTSNQSVHYPLELLHHAPINQADLQLFQKLPAILVRLTQLSYIEQLRTLFACNVKSYQLMQASDVRTAVTFTECLKMMMSPTMKSSFMTPILPLESLSYDLDIDMDASSSPQPSPGLLMQAITRRSTGEQMDHENLEVLGDCFLKLAVSIALYTRDPLAGAGLLSLRKTMQISNENLYRLAVKKDLKPYLYVQKIVFRGKDANWLPPGYIINSSKTEIEERYLQQHAKRKAFSDMLEALMGAFLVSTDYMTTLKFMCWLGVDAIPFDSEGHLMALPSIVRASPSSGADDQIERIINTFFVDRSFKDIETKINYVFKDKAYLIAAFTHPSNFANRITDCYERLEFLGDAVLDYLVTRHIFVNYNENVSPGRVTDIRQDLSNNGRLAYILVACGLHTKILYNSTDLFSSISSYAGNEDLFPIGKTTEEYLSEDLDQWADTGAPKALADVFEALVGAIFLDSDNCLKTVWDVCEPLLRKYIDRSMTHPNLNPVRWFSEQGGETLSETVDKSGEQPIALCVVRMPDGSVFEGRASNKKRAKADACQKAMKIV